LRIASFLEERDVTCDVPVGNKREVLAALVDVLVTNHLEFKREVLLQVLLKREELRSTGIEHGVAFPHGRIPGLTRILACFGRCRPGVDFDAFDGKPTHFFFVLLIPESAESDHLKALARLNRVFQDDDFRRRLLYAKDTDAVFSTIMERDNKF
jgi:PTS system nitrogen regulatory IIA component